MLVTLRRRIDVVRRLNLPVAELLEEHLTLSHAAELRQCLLAITQIVNDVHERLAVTVDEDPAILLDQRFEVLAAHEHLSEETVLLLVQSGNHNLSFVSAADIELDHFSVGATRPIQLLFGLVPVLLFLHKLVANFLHSVLLAFVEFCNFLLVVFDLLVDFDNFGHLLVDELFLKRL